MFRPFTNILGAAAVFFFFLWTFLSLELFCNGVWSFCFDISALFAYCTVWVLCMYTLSDIVELCAMRMDACFENCSQCSETGDETKNV